MQPHIDPAFQVTGYRGLLSFSNRDVDQIVLEDTAHGASAVPYRSLRVLIG